MRNLNSEKMIIFLTFFLTLLPFSAVAQEIDYSGKLALQLANAKPIVEICHSGNTISVALPAVVSHLIHGDSIGICEWDECSGDPDLCDKDGDGLTNSEDLCPFSPPGVPNLISGCSAIDLLQAPETALIKIKSNLEWAIDETGRLEGIEHIVKDLQGIEKGILLTEHRARSGSACQTSIQLAVVDQEVKAILVKADDLVTEAWNRWQGIAITNSIGTGDAYLEEKYREMLFTRNRINALVEAIEETSGILDKVCSNTSSIKGYTGVVSFVDNSLRRIHLNNGQVFGLAESAKIGGQGISEGVNVLIAGFDLGNGMGIAREIATSDPVIIIPDTPKLSSCMQLRFVPVQLRPPFRKAPMVLHHPDGYFEGERFRLEKGMGIAAEFICEESGNYKTPRQSFVRRSFQLDFTYRDTVINSYVTINLAPDIGHEDDPTYLPLSINPHSEAILEVTERRQLCKVDLSNNTGEPEISCSAPEVAGTETYGLFVMEKGHYCVVSNYDFGVGSGDKVFFSIDEKNPDDFRPARVTEWSSSVPGFEPPGVFEAQGYKAVPSSAAGEDYTSSFPAPYTISQEETFSIHNTDFYPVFPEMFTWTIPFFNELRHGVDKACGLRWPRIKGVRNGREFSYSCRMPQVVRDVINNGFSCSGDDSPDGHTFYQLPFSKYDENWVMSQGSDPGDNYTCGTHKHYALDLHNWKCDSEILAARSGRVYAVVDTMSEEQKSGCTAENVSCGYTCCPAGSSCSSNVVKVRHQDGTSTIYRHMGPNDVFVKKGDLIRRGQLIGLVGSTGHSSGPHLHFTAARQMFFEAVNLDDEDKPVVQCYDKDPYNAGENPCVNIPLESNNEPLY